ncbi:TonB-dependent receptor [Bacteroides sp. 51]|uniref:SusC/RagA family TonB-linked outer membrane protein n=1 Tax=Bacteroides sp. 51 TaxID=2302938 RepID=UPI0013D07218|nr:TonB-dependent receptor [Bacteroides sp. 51]NDV83779.1 TonB-dependent receptor [Bacteroides sp. 51]
MKMNRRENLPGSRKILFALLALLISCSAFAQTMTVQGQIVDSAKEPIIGASILEKGTTNGTISDFDGNFTLSVNRGATLLITYIGYKPMEVKATANLNVTLTEDNELLDEVVVIGYGSVKRKDVTTSISSVSTKDLDQRPILSAAQAMQGKAAGVSVVATSGEPGATLSIRVRGTTSLNGSNDPLYVVDGVPMTDIKFLSANDIESMQVLKDASSAAIYGSRAANGVVMITTKQGAVGQAKVTLNVHAGVTKVSNKIKSLNTAQYKDLMDEVGLVNLPDDLTDQTDWFDETYRTGVTQNYQVSVASGTDKLRYYLSGGYTGEDGVIKTAFFKRYNFRANVENQVRSWLKISGNVAYSDNTTNGIISGTGSNRAGVILSVINTPKYASVYNEDGTYNNSFYGVNITSPLENMARSKHNKYNSARLLATGKAEVTLLPELIYRGSMTLDRYDNIETTFLDPETTSYGRDQKGQGTDDRSRSTVLVFDNIVNYTKAFKKHNLDVMLGSSWTKSIWSRSHIVGSHYANASIPTLNAANKISWTDTWTTSSEWSIYSYVGRVAYNYDSKYLITANMRADGSSKLDPDHRWGYFPSVSAAWRMSSESFMSDIKWIDDLKIRGGWGQTGNQSGLGDYAYLQMNSIQRQQWFGDNGDANAVPSITNLSSLRNKDLTWETTTQTNIGFDLTVLNSRLTFSADYYYKKTTDMLMTVTLPEGQAASNIKRNEGEMTNKGLEFTLNSKNFTGAFQWDTDFNISFNKNKLTKLSLTKIYYTAKTSEYVNDYVVRNEPGRPLGGFYGYISDGVDPETGELMYRDLTDDNVISPADRTYIGDPNPDFTFGLTNTFSWKNFTLNVFLQGSYGNDIYNASRMETEGMYDGKNQSTAVLDRWRIPGQITSVPKAKFDMKNSTYFVEDGSYLRVKDVTLSYNVRSKLLRKWGISRCQPYFTATNLITWTDYSGMDPEVNQWGNNGAVQGIDWGTYPHSKSFIFGVNIEF